MFLRLILGCGCVQGWSCQRGVETCGSMIMKLFLGMAVLFWIIGSTMAGPMGGVGVLMYVQAYASEVSLNLDE